MNNRQNCRLSNTRILYLQTDVAASFVWQSAGIINDIFFSLLRKIV